MNIDKFGHHVHKRLRQPQETTGDIDLHSAKIKGLKSPTSADEAVNKAYVDQIIKSFVTIQELNNEIIKIDSNIDSNMNNLRMQLNHNYCTKSEVNQNYCTKSEVANMIRAAIQRK